MMNLKRARTLMATLAIGLLAATVAMDHADARRGGGFGSRGMRTYQAPAPTPTAPRAAPIERSTAPRMEQSPSAARQTAAQPRQGLFGGMGRTLLGGLLVGGLIGMLLGNGLGGLAGLLGLLVQVGLIVAAVMLVRRWMSRRSEPAHATAGGEASKGFQFSRAEGDMGASAAEIRPSAVKGMNTGDLIGITQGDLDVFEQRLIQVQSAFAREDFEALRRLGTPEVMSHFAEELGRNATRGLRNQVSDVKLLQGDLSEAWREGDDDYATVAMRYELRDIMLDRTTGELREGDPEDMVELTEVWTFRRTRGGEWMLSAIQDT